MNLRWQFQWNGNTLINQRFLVCPRCLDKPAPFLKTVIIPPDPKPVLNPRPEPYAADEAGPVQNILGQLVYPAASIGAFYLDLYDGDPNTTGQSVLNTLTGSSTRTDFASSMGTPVDGVSSNTVAIVFTTDALTSAVVSYLAVYDAATAGTLLTSAQIANPQTIVMDNGAGLSVGSLRVSVS